MNTVQAYQKSIDVLMNTELNYKDLIFKLVQANPVMFLDLVNGTTTPVEPEVNSAIELPEVPVALRNILGYMLSNQKIEAIKAIRKKYSLDLKSAKDIADNLQDALAQLGEIHYYSNSPDRQAAELDGYNKIFFDEIYRARYCVGL